MSYIWGKFCEFLRENSCPHKQSISERKDYSLEFVKRNDEGFFHRDNTSFTKTVWTTWIISWTIHFLKNILAKVKNYVMKSVKKIIFLKQEWIFREGSAEVQITLPEIWLWFQCCRLREHCDSSIRNSHRENKVQLDSVWTENTDGVRRDRRRTTTCTFRWKE